MIPAHVHQILEHDLLVCQLAVVALGTTPILLLLVMVELLELFVDLLGIHLVDIDVWSILVEVRGLQRLDVHLVLEGAQLELIELLSILITVPNLLVWKLPRLHLVQEVTILCRHVPFLCIHPDGVGTQAGAVVPEVLREHHIWISLVEAKSLGTTNRGAIARHWREPPLKEREAASVREHILSNLIL